MRKTPLVQVDGIRQVDGSGISIMCNSLYVGLQSLPLVALLFTFMDHCERSYLESVVDTFLVWPREERQVLQ
jgi:hypothetical protein